jgi:hypothetical protein
MYQSRYEEFDNQSHIRANGFSLFEIAYYIIFAWIAQHFRQIVRINDQFMLSQELFIPEMPGLHFETESSAKSEGRTVLTVDCQLN